MFRMSTPVVVIGFILLIPSALFILVDLLGLLAFLFVPVSDVDETSVAGLVLLAARWLCSLRSSLSSEAYSVGFL